MFTFLFVANLLGVFDFAFEGTIEARKANASKPMTAIIGMISTYGGGFFGDLVVLHVTPSVFSAGLELLFALLTIFFADRVCRSRKQHAYLKTPYVKVFFALTETLGCIAFAISGVERAVAFNASFPAVIVRAWCSCCVGGCIRMIITRKSIKEILCTSPLYRIYAFMITLLYTTYRGCPDNVYTITIIAVVAGLFIRAEVRTIMKMSYKKAVSMFSGHNNLWASMSDQSIRLMANKEYTIVKINTKPTCNSKMFPLRYATPICWH